MISCMATGFIFCRSDCRDFFLHITKSSTKIPHAFRWASYNSTLPAGSTYAPCYLAKSWQLNMRFSRWIFFEINQPLYIKKTKSHVVFKSRVTFDSSKKNKFWWFVYFLGSKLFGMVSNLEIHHSRIKSLSTLPGVCRAKTFEPSAGKGVDCAWPWRWTHTYFLPTSGWVQCSAGFFFERILVWDLDGMPRKISKWQRIVEKLRVVLCCVVRLVFLREIFEVWCAIDLVIFCKKPEEWKELCAVVFGEGQTTFGVISHIPLCMQWWSQDSKDCWKVNDRNFLSAEVWVSREWEGWLIRVEKSWEDI